MRGVSYRRVKFTGVRFLTQVTLSAPCMAPSVPLVSIVIPAYNAASTVERTLASAQAQTYPRLEVIVVDDGSTDDTAERVQSVARHDARVRLVAQPNAGVAAARNTGIAAANGNLIAPLDADDIWLPSKISAQVAALRHAPPNVGMVYAWWVSVDDRDAVVGVAHPWSLTGEVADPLVHVNFIGNASVPLYRRDIVEAVGGYRSRLMENGGQGCEDWDLALRVAEHAPVGLAPAYLVGYRAAAQSMSSNIEQMAASFDVMIHDVSVRRPRLPRRLLREARAHFYQYLTTRAAASVPPAHVLRRLWRTLCVDPARIGVPHLWRIAGENALAWCLGAPPASKRPAAPARTIPFDAVAALRPRDLPHLTRLYRAPGQVRWSWRPFDWIERRRWQRLCRRCASPSTLGPPASVGPVTPSEKPHPDLPTNPSPVSH